VVAGLGELHELGFVHRDLKPENIVLTLDRPIKVALIDFDRALPTSNKSLTGPRGTPGYQPDTFKFEDGDVQWDLYSLVAIIAEADMGVNEYLKVQTEREGKGLLTKHLKDPKTCKELAALVNAVILAPRGAELPTFHEVAASIKKISFRKDVRQWE